MSDDYQEPVNDESDVDDVAGDTQDDASAIAELREQVNAHSDYLRFLKKEINSIVIALAIGLGIAAVMVLAAEFKSPPQPTSDDYSESELLRVGPHCYNSAEEMAAARQRALAALDRREWDARHETATNSRSDVDTQMFGPTDAGNRDPGLAIKKIGDPPSGPADSADPALCFKVTLEAAAPRP